MASDDIPDRVSELADALSGQIPPVPLERVQARRQRRSSRAGTAWVMASAVVLIAGAVAIVAWRRSSSESVGTESPSSSPVSSTPVAESRVPESSVAEVPATLPPTGSVLPDGTPVLFGATLHVDVTDVRPGDEIFATLECPVMFAESAYVGFAGASVMMGGATYTGDLIEVRRDDALSGPDVSTLVGSVVIPYWLPAGPQQLIGFCGEPVAEPEPVTLHVIPPESGRWDAWRPHALPTLDPMPAQSGVSSDGYWYWQPLPGETARAVAVCDADASLDGARFVLWDRIPADMLPPFDRWRAVITMIELPADARRPVDGGIEISVEIQPDQLDIPPTGRLRITALCTATPTPFQPDAEPLEPGGEPPPEQVVIVFP